jgi:hypothetical protein
MNAKPVITEQQRDEIKRLRQEADATRASCLKARSILSMI